MSSSGAGIAVRDGREASEVHTPWVRNKTASEKSRTALRTPETLDLVVVARDTYPQAQRAQRCWSSGQKLCYMTYARILGRG